MGYKKCLLFSVLYHEIKFFSNVMPNLLKFNKIPKNTVHKSLIVHDMNNNDLDNVFAIETAAHPFPWTKKMFLDSLTGDYINWVLVSKNEIIGFIIFYLQAGECNILNLCIKAKEQNKGYGSKLLKKVIAYAKKNMAHMIFLEVRKSNIAAIKLYYKMGFKKSGVRKNYYNGKEDALILQLNISET